jgi:hypothetical protein
LLEKNEKINPCFLFFLTRVYFFLNPKLEGGGVSSGKGFMPGWQNFKSAFLVEFEWPLSQYESTTGVVGIQNLGDSAMYFFTQEILKIKSKLLTFVFESTKLINTN